MTQARVRAPKILGVATCVPARRFDNVADTTEFTADEVKRFFRPAKQHAIRKSGDLH